MRKDARRGVEFEELLEPEYEQAERQTRSGEGLMRAGSVNEGIKPISSLASFPTKHDALNRDQLKR